MKKIQKTNIASLLDDNYSIGNYLVNNALENKVLLKYEEELRELDEIKINDIYEAANFVFKNPSIQIIYPGDKYENN